MQHTVCETRAFQAAAAEAGMSRAEIDRFIDAISREPDAGAVLTGTGGCRKVRAARRGKGKSGSYRVITFFTGPNLPDFLIAVFGKTEKANLTKAERNALEKMTKTLLAEYRNQDVMSG